MDRPAAAKDLYVSDGFRKQRAYAEATGLPWYILSAEHGLVAPDEWLAPYDRYPPDTPRGYRQAWGMWVVARLELLEGPLNERVIEVHAAAAYVDAVRPHLTGAGATVRDPLAGMAKGQRLRWYNEQARDAASSVSHLLHERPAAIDGTEVTAAILALSDESSCRTPAELRGEERRALSTGGLYSWWVDDAGAVELSRYLGFALEPGLIYAGQAGASSSNAGKASAATLGSRLIGQHLGGNSGSSTFRKTLMSILGTHPDVLGSEEKLTRWMEQHLQVIPYAVVDRAQLGSLEQAVLARLDPPLNLQHMSRTPLRTHLKTLRRQVTS